MQRKLKPEIIQRIKSDEILQANIANALVRKRKISTVRRWLKEENEILLLPTIQELIIEHFNLGKADLLTSAKRLRVRANKV